MPYTTVSNEKSYPRLHILQNYRIVFPPLLSNYSGVEERYLGRLKRAHVVEISHGNLAKFGETFVCCKHKHGNTEPSLSNFIQEGVETRW